MTKWGKGSAKTIKGARTASTLERQAVKHFDEARGLCKRVENGLIGCFTAGTQIVVGMEYDANDNFVSYVTVNIEDVKVGDLVYSYNTLTGETELCAVTSTLAKTSDHINYLTIIDENGNEQTIETTDVHPFWVVTDEPDLSRAARSVIDENGLLIYHENLESGLNGYWVEAKDLRVGDVFLGANGELSTLTNIVRVEQADGIAVFNFTVEGNHNYYILAKEYEYGQTCILVHNGDCSLYKAVSKDGLPYYGITSRAAPVRAAEHLKTTGHKIEKTLLEGLTRREARAAEQLMINEAGLGNLANKINSIAPGNQAVFAPEMLKVAKLLEGVQ